MSRVITPESSRAREIPSAKNKTAGRLILLVIFDSGKPGTVETETETILSVKDDDLLAFNPLFALFLAAATTTAP